MKVKIIEKGYAGYTGPLGRINFVDAVSEGEVSAREALMLGGYIRLVEVDDEGNEIGPVSHAAELARTRNLSARVLEPLKRGDDTAPSPDVAEQADAQPVTVKIAPEPTNDPENDSDVERSAPNPLPVERAPDAKVWTRAELEAIADKSGIKGVREIGTPMGVKNTSIPKLIDEILAAQTQGQKA